MHPLIIDSPPLQALVSHPSNTALMIASTRGDVNVARMLLRCPRTDIALQGPDSIE